MQTNLTSQVANQIINLRAWVAENRNAPGYLASLVEREASLCEAARNAWGRMTSEELNEALDAVKPTREGLVIGEFSSIEFREALAQSKQAAGSCDFFSGEFQIVALDANGGRTGTSDEGPVAFTSRPTLGMLKKIFADCPEAVKLSIVAEGYYYGTGTLAERFEYREPADVWSDLTIFRDRA